MNIATAKMLAPQLKTRNSKLKTAPVSAYQQTIDYLYQQLPMFQRIGAAAYKKDLGNTLALCAHLDNPQGAFPSIHVGGTNGKGSVSHMLAAICQAAGLKTGLYISPHYRDFRERIKINGQYIPRRAVVDFVRSNRPTIDEVQPSFFELCVAMAFDHFAKQKVDIAIVEVGLGGRLDSTNVITPLLSVITNISYDHMNLLGDTLPQIAFEKAGIIKPGIPVVIGETHPESAPVFLQKAQETASDLAFADQHFSVREKPTHAGSQALLAESSVYDVLKDGKVYLQNLAVDAAGTYQSKNVATVLQTLESLRMVLERGNIPTLVLRQQLLNVVVPEATVAGLGTLRSRTRFIGRWQRIGERPTVLCDSAHNEAGLKEAFGRIEEWYAAQSAPLPRLHLVTGFVNDKDLDKALSLFPAHARYYFAKANIPRGLDANALQTKAAGFGLHGRAYTSVKRALAAAQKTAAPEDLILVIGSVFVVAEVLPV